MKKKNTDLDENKFDFFTNPKNSRLKLKSDFLF